MLNFMINTHRIMAMLLSGLALVIYTDASATGGEVYKSTGQYGEVRYTQTRPIGVPAQAVSVYQSTELSRADNTGVCQHLRQNLMTLSSGGTIHEIDDKGNKVLLSASDIARHLAETKSALSERCPQ